ncbi:MAG: hypothetical protein LN560_03445 [Rickettsia endosymbiont of Sceptobius lativentris]|nr:hypothetical protein [Rickettsia endosymbiont of Sceptobius lativentris]
MSITFTLQGNSNVLETNFYPPIDISMDDCEIALIGLYTYNTIPNIEEGCNKFYYDKDKVITIPTGAYEIRHIEKYLQDKLQETNNNKNVLQLIPNNNTIKSELYCEYEVDFTKPDSIGSIIGFSNKQILQPKKWHYSDIPVRIIKVTSIRVECNIVKGSYYDNDAVHTLYEFSPQVDPGYAINIEPRNNVYLGVNTKTISNITLNLIDQDGTPVNFRGEKIVIRLELRNTKRKWE